MVEKLKYLYLFIALLLISCSDLEQPKNSYIEYSLANMKHIPDENKDKNASCVAEIMKGASNRLTTSDYEDVADAIEQAQETCNEIYIETKIGLNVYTRDERTNQYSSSSLNLDPKTLKGHFLEVYNELVNTNKPYIREEFK